LKIHKKYISFLLAFFILFTGTLLGSEIIIDKTMLPRLLSVNIVFFCTLFLLRGKLYIRIDAYLLIFTVFFIFNILSAFWSVSIQEVFSQSQLVFLSLSCFIITVMLKNDFEDFENIFTKIVLFFILFSFILVARTMISLEYFDPYKIKSISANNNLYSGFVFLSLAFSINGIIKFKKFFKYLSLFILLISIFVMIILQSRSIYLSLLTTLLLTILIVFIRYREVINTKFIITSFIFIFALGLSVTFFYNSLDPIRKNYFENKLIFWQYFKSSVDNSKISENNSQDTTNIIGNQLIPALDEPQSYYENVNLRMIFWKKSFYLFQDNPIIGIGSGNWKLNIASAIDPPNPNHTQRNYTYSYPHNEYIGLLTELGIIGFIIGIIIWFFIPVYILFCVIKKNKPLDFSITVYSAVIIGFFVFAFFDFPLKRVEHNIMLFSIMGFAYFPIMSNFNDYSHLKVKVQKIVFLTLLLFILSSVLISFFRFKGEYFTLKMFKYERKNDKNVIMLCEKAENIFYKITPNTLPLNWFSGVAYFRSGNVEKANELFKKAIMETPYEVRVLNDYATSLVLLNKNEEAKIIFSECLRLDPYFDDSKFNLSAIYVFDNQLDSALYYINLCSDSRKKLDYLTEIKEMIETKNK
jgi:hypothetical protein